MSPLTLYRLSRFFFRLKMTPVAKAIKALNYLIFNCVLPPECEIGEGTRLFHSGLGIILHPDVVIGKNCNLYNFIVLGGGHDGPDGPPIKIVVGDNVNIGAGAKILAKDVLSIGTGSSVAANSVVVENVPEYVVVAGIPAQVVKNKPRNAP